MKHIVYIILFVGIQVNAQDNEKPVSVRCKDCPLLDVLKTIEHQAGLMLTARPYWMSHAKPITIDVSNVLPEVALDSCFKEQPLTYSIVNKCIKVKEKDITGNVVLKNGEPAAGAKIAIQGTSWDTITNAQGDFTIKCDKDSLVLVISFAKYIKQEIKIKERYPYNIILEPDYDTLPSFVFTKVNTGFQKMSREKATGSFATEDSTFFDKRVSTNVLERLKDVFSGLTFLNNPYEPGSHETPSVLGQSTLLGDGGALIVIDDGVYTGLLPIALHPTELGEISLLKDAAAASIWGSKSGNGVLVINTKKGSYNSTPKVSFNSSITLLEKPDAFYKPQMSPSGFVDMEQLLFGKDYFSGQLNDPGHLPVSPVVRILSQKNNGSISADDADRLLETLRSQDVRRDFNRYLYRGGVNQQYTASISGGSAAMNYKVTGGVDHNTGTIKDNGSYRNTFSSYSQYKLFPTAEFSLGINFQSVNIKSNNGIPDIAYPYALLADANGSPSVVVKDYDPGYIDTAGTGILADWKYRPLEETGLQQNKTRQMDLRIRTGLEFTIKKYWGVQALYFHNSGNSYQQNIYDQQSYFARNLRNLYTVVIGSIINRNIPAGDIADLEELDYASNNLRLKLTFNKTWGRHSVSVLGGTEMLDSRYRVNARREYGYDESTGSGVPVDRLSLFPLYHNPAVYAKIPAPTFNETTIDRSLSKFINADYTFSKKISFSASARKDKSNIFGQDNNKYGIPLWSVGGAWTISKERFFPTNLFNYLKLRITYGSNGNVYRLISARTTISIPGLNSYNQPAAVVNNPPNPNLRWEKVNQQNFGIDFRSRKGIVSGSIEKFTRNGVDLIGTVLLDPTTGISSYLANNAEINSNGWDIILKTRNLKGKIKWNTTILVNIARSKVIKYDADTTAIWVYCDPRFSLPLPGKPVDALFSLKWAGLTHDTGDPQGYVNNKESTDYAAILNSVNTDDLVYSGPKYPPFSGTIRNSFTWKNFELMFGIKFKLGHYFRRPTIQYSEVYNGQSWGHPDIDKRWRNPGDEMHTNIPSLPFPANSSRDLFFAYSQATVEKGDHIRLQDIYLGYEFTGQQWKKSPFRSLTLFTYANNLGILWKATKEPLDPDYISGIPVPRTVSFGIRANLKN